ncbi:rod shape-determining protein RodA, partial [Candidatus Aerophobetes bacterium]
TGSLFARLVSGGIIMLLFLQVFISLGMVAGLMPVTGIPLPLMSYGGSSVLMFLMAIGILASIDRLGLKY